MILYCLSHLSAHYLRISVKDELSKRPDAGLRFIINKAVAQLKQGNNVVIDDENGSKAKRQSFIKIVKDKVSDCSLRSIRLIPKCGRDQLLWSVAYLQATWLETNEFKNQTETCPYQENMLDKWVTGQDGGIEVPSYGEGFHNIVDVSKEFTVHSYYKFEVPGLLIQFEGILDRDEEHIVNGVVTALDTWCSANPCGCVIFVYGYVTGIHPTDKHETMCKTLKEVISKLPSLPIFVISIDTVLPSSSFFALPQSGVMALCSRLFHLDLSHKASMYLYSTKDHLKCAENAGIKYIKAQRIFQHPKMVTSYTMATNPSIPEVLKHCEVKWSKPDIPEAKVPLLQDAEEKDGFVYAFCSLDGRISLHLCAYSKECCDSFNQLYQEQATPIKEEGSRLDKFQKERKVSTIVEDFAPTLEAVASRRSSSSKSRRSSASSDTSVITNAGNRDLPKWMMKKTAGSNEKTDSPITERKSPKKAKTKILTTVYVMSPAELINVAGSILGQTSEKDSLDQSFEDLTPKKQQKSGGKRQEPIKRQILTPSDVSKIERDLQEESFKFDKDDIEEPVVVKKFGKRKTCVESFRSKIERDLQKESFKFVKEEIDSANTNKVKRADDYQETCLDDIFGETKVARKRKPPKTKAVKRSPVISDEEDRPAKMFASNKNGGECKKEKTVVQENDFSFLDDITF